MTPTPEEIALAKRVADASGWSGWVRQIIVKEVLTAIMEVREKLINAPETKSFMVGVPLEATHQRERWGDNHDADKGPLDWFWLIGYLSQKAATAAIEGDIEKAKHHTISTAAALANWHLSMSDAPSATGSI